MDRIIESTVPDSSGGQRLDLYLSKRFGYLSRTAWQKEIDAGRVLLNGRNAGSKKKICAGDRVCYHPSEISEPDVDRNYSVIYEDEFFIAVNKPGNLPIHPSGVFFSNTLVMIMEEERGCRFYPVHRIDRETSGLILLGRDSSSASAVQRNFANVHKTYVALAAGTVKEQNFTVDVPIGPARNSAIKKKREAYEGAGESAVTGFSLIEAGDECSLVRASPVTGRTHQIRVHLSWYGHHIVGDKMYGRDETVYMDYTRNGDSPELAERAGFSRCALHSGTLTFFHPHEKKEITLEAPLASDMKNLVRLRGFKHEEL